MKVFVVLAAVLAFAAAQDNCCTAGDVQVILRNWESVWGAQFSGRRVAIGQAVFANFLNRVPDAKDLFKRVKVDQPDSPEFKAHIIRIVNGIDAVLNLLTDPAGFDSAVKFLSGQHAVRDGVKASMFKELAGAFDDVLPMVIPGFNSDAWTACFAKIARGIAAGLPA